MAGNNKFHEKQVHPIGGTIHIFTLDIPSAVIGAVGILLIKAIVTSTINTITRR